VLLTLWAAAAGGALLAAFGLAVDARANAVGRRRELAVLHTLGTSPGGLARSLVVEQAVLAGLGVVAGVAVGVGVAAAMGTSLVLTSAGAVPVPEPLLTLVPEQLSAPTVGLFVVAVVLGALVARRARREVAAGALRIGED
jgi:ABC-type antimicrobial peptide transport system permease subunit